MTLAFLVCSGALLALQEQLPSLDWLTSVNALAGITLTPLPPDSRTAQPGAAQGRDPHPVEHCSLWRRITLAQYSVDFQRCLARVDPLLPILGGLSAAGSAGFALASGGHAAVLGWLGCALIVLVVLASVAIAEPINFQFRRLPEGKVPPGAQRAPRRASSATGGELARCPGWILSFCPRRRLWLGRAGGADPGWAGTR